MVPSSIPFVAIDFRLRLSAGEIIYWGVRHQFQPGAPSLTALSEEIRPYAERALFLVEGIPNLSPDRSESVRERSKALLFGMDRPTLVSELGERGIAVDLARTYDRPIYSPEPSEQVLAEMLLEAGYDLLQIVGFHTLLSLSGHLSQQEQLGRQTELLEFVDECIRMFVAKLPDSLKESIPTQRPGFGLAILQQFSPEIAWEHVTSAMILNLLTGNTEEGYDDSFIARLTKAHSQAREQFVASAAINYLNDYPLVVIVFGVSHTIGVLTHLANRTDAIL